MSLRSFKIENQKAVVLAEVATVPSVMVIAGPNGVGKSTVLYAVKNGAGKLDPADTRVIYQGPHRVLRRTSVQRRWLGGPMKWLQDLMTSGGDVSGYEGLNFQNSQRTPDNVDEAGSTIKHTLGKIENRRLSLLARVVDRSVADKKTSLDISSIPIIYEPLQTLTKHLLPHLIFSRIDFDNEDNIRCLWTRTDDAKIIELDIDDLSSGEKSIVVLFLPLLEDQIRERLSQFETLATKAEKPATDTLDRVVLIDEPEQHLHPDLQAKILTYMRTVSRDAHVQFVITTHSPTILDQAFDDELFALFPPSSTPGENQLRRIASNAERLEALKQLTGSAYFLTTGRVVVCIEGEPASEDGTLSDLTLFEMMYPRATAFTLVPTRGKGNVINTVKSLRSHVPEETFRIRVRGLVDADQSETGIAGVETLPVCMIENLLLDPAILYTYVMSLEVATLPDIAAVTKELSEIVATLRDTEIALRVRRKIRGWTIRIGGASIEAVKAQQASEIEHLKSLIADEEKLTKEIADISAHVDKIIADGNALDRFRGKEILKEFHRKHVAAKNIGFKEMCIEIAKRVGKDNSEKIAGRLDPIFDKISK